MRGFARYRSASDTRTEIPPSDLLPNKSKRARPYLYTDKEIKELLEAALNLPRSNTFRKRTYYCLFGLLSVTGMRVGEAINLQINNVDLEAGILTVARSKFGKSRLVPIHPTTQKVLSNYVSCRNEILRGRRPAYFFISGRGTRLDESEVGRMFRRLSRQTGLREQHTRNGPRIHDMRHCFAIGTLLRWYRNGDDAERHLPALSTYLGHVNIDNTYWYLSACPELMAAAVGRLEQRWEGKS